MKLPSQRSGFHICDILELNNDKKFDKDGNNSNSIKKENNKKDREKDKCDTRKTDSQKSAEDEKRNSHEDRKIHLSSSDTKYLSHLLGSANSFASASATTPAMFADAYSHLFSAAGRPWVYEGGSNRHGKLFSIF
jgi:hypothetical protein